MRHIDDKKAADAHQPEPIGNGAAIVHDMLQHITGENRVLALFAER